jgi:FHS family L-fucose permease-like MFS transporter
MFRKEDRGASEMATQEVVSKTSAVLRVEAIAATTPNYTRPLALVTTLFFMWGFLTSLNDILVPHLKSIFDLTYAQAMLVQFAFFSAYFLFSVPWSKVVNRVGYQRTMVVGLLTMACGALLFIPAATAASYPLFLAALLILAAGITGLQVSANPYVDLLGKPETASSRLDLTQAFNSLGTTLAPKLGGLLILSEAPLAIERLRQLAPQALHAYRVQQTASVKVPYTVISIALVGLAVLIARFNLPKVEAEASGPAEKTKDSIWQHPNLLLGAIGIFSYVGAEVSIGSFLVNYFGLPEIAGLSPKSAAGFVSFYWGGAMIGRFLGALLLRRLKAGYLLGFCAICAATLVTVSMLIGGHGAMWSIVAVGLFNSIMFPTIFSLGVSELGPLTGSGSGVLNTAIVGGAVLPVIQGAIADTAGLHYAFILPVLCYLYILFYGLNGSKPNSVRDARA